MEAIASNLGLQRVGIIFTQSVSSAPRDYTLSGAEVKLVAELHGESDLPEFVAAVVKLAGGEEDGQAPSVHFEAFQMSDQCVKLATQGWLLDGEEGVEPKFSKMSQNVVLAGRDTTEVDNDFFLVPVRILDHQVPLTLYRLPSHRAMRWFCMCREDHHDNPSKSWKTQLLKIETRESSEKKRNEILLWTEVFVFF